MAWTHEHANGTRWSHPDGEDCEDPGRGQFGMPTLGGDAGRLLPPFFEDEAEAISSVPFHSEPRPTPFKCVITPEEMILDFGEEGLRIPAVTEEAHEILTSLPTILEDFLESNAKYARAQTGHDLGAMGIIPDINRKTAVIISRIWDRAPAGRGEATTVVIDDLIGHLLLLRAKLIKEGASH